MLVHGSCHCANIAFTLHWEPVPSEIPARACTCSFCIKHGAVWASSPTASLRVIAAMASRVSRYAFGTNTSQFHVCSNCGIVPLVTSRIGGRLYAVVNVNAFEGVDASLLRQTSVALEEETEDTRLARRARSWIADVDYREIGA